MAVIDRSTRRAIAVIALLVLAAVALRGYLPGHEDVAERQRPASSPLALVVDIALLPPRWRSSGSPSSCGCAIAGRGRPPGGSCPRGPAA